MSRRRLKEIAARAEAARRVTLPEHIENWERGGVTAERIIRDLRRILREDLASNPNITYTSTAGIQLSPEWENGEVTGYEVLVQVGTIKP